MENNTIELNEPTIKMLGVMLKGFSFTNFVQENLEPGNETQIKLYENSFHTLLNDIAEIEIVNNI